jgi:hypothetical protein
MWVRECLSWSLLWSAFPGAADARLDWGGWLACILRRERAEQGIPEAQGEQGEALEEHLVSVIWGEAEELLNECLCD